MKKIILLGICSFLLTVAEGQNFVTRAKIEFEKKIDMHKSFYANSPDNIKDLVPKYQISYSDYVFAGNEALYKPGREAADQESPGFIPAPNKNILYTNYTTRQKVTCKNLFEEDYLIEDSIKPITWKIGQETRTIAGYECRKAIGRIYDTVYVVAFYAEEIVIKGGPEGFQGLPGMILGVAIPRYNTTWWATKVELANINEAEIVPPHKGKKLKRAAFAEEMTKKFQALGATTVKPQTIEHLWGGFML
ncbi:MAG TPA: GLPGLI family protein [Puia sp.]|nr:GLPGLI family protein [Puia sp.]